MGRVVYVHAVFTCVSGRVGWRAALCVALGRAAHGAGAALAGVAGLALAARAVPQPQRDRAIGALLGAVALGNTPHLSPSLRYTHICPT